MPAVTLNSTSFAGTVYDTESVRRAPFSVDVDAEKPGIELLAEDGTQTIILFNSGTPKRTWTIMWKRIPETTRAAVYTIFLLATTFAFVDPVGTSHTVQCGLKAYTEKTDTEASLPNGTRYFDVTLVVREP